MYPNQPQYGQPQQPAPQQYQQYPPQQYPAAPQQAPAGIAPGGMPSFAAPAPAGSSDRLKPEQVNGHLLVVAPIEFLPAFFPGKTDNKGNVSDPSDAIRCDVVDLDGNGGQGMTALGIVWGQTVLVASLKRTLDEEPAGTVVVARMGRGVAKGGNSAPWLLESAMTDPAAVERAQQFYARRPNWRREKSDVTMMGEQQAQQMAPGAGFPPGSVPAVPAPNGGYMPAPQQPQYNNAGPQQWPTNPGQQPNMLPPGYDQQQAQQPYGQPYGAPQSAPPAGYPAGPPVQPQSPEAQAIAAQMGQQQQYGQPQQYPAA